MRAFLVGLIIVGLSACSQDKASIETPVEAQEITEPVSVSPATQRLTAWNSEFEREIIEITDGVYVASGYAASIFTFIEGDTGIVMVDGGQLPDVSAEALQDFRDISSKPIAAIIYTHSHGDHVNGARAFAPDGAEGFEVWARANFGAETRAFSSSGITINRRRGVRQAGFQLPPENRINNGVAPVVYPTGPDAFNPANVLRPTHTFDDEQTVLNIAGITLELVANPGETSDQLYVWYPEKRVVFAGDNFYKSWPNLYAIRGTPYRDVEAWANAIDALLSVEAEYLVGGHTRPISGAEAVRTTLEAYRDGIRSIFTQTIEGINQGLTPDELVETVRLPDSLASAEVLTPYYGNPEWAVRAIFSGYLGWFDGNPTNLFALAPRDEAERMADLAGGADRLLARAETALAAGDPQWTAQLCDYLLALDYETTRAQLLKADALAELAERNLTATARNYYLTVAQELRKAADDASGH